MQSAVEMACAEARPALGQGKVATYIPALAAVDPQQLGIAACDNAGHIAIAGDADTGFSIQSISKVFTLTMAMRAVHESLWQRVGVEPSGDPFNSLIQLEHERGRPRNPLINAGAIVVADLLHSAHERPLDVLRELVSELAGDAVDYDLDVAASERATGHRNRAMAWFMKSFGQIDNDVDAVLDLYFHQCSLSMSCRQLARAFRYLANDGIDPASGSAIVSDDQARRINALMLTCGTYDYAGQFAFDIGLPAKSGVGGGVVGIVPNSHVICAWSPALGPSGNSVAAVAALKHYVRVSGVSIL